MNKKDLIEALSGIDESHLTETAELLTGSAYKMAARKKRRIRAALTACVAILLTACLLLGALMHKQDPPVAPESPSSSVSTVFESNDTSAPPFGDVNARVEVRRSYIDGVNYVSFTPTEEILSLCQYIKKSEFTLPEHIPTRYNRTGCMPFQNMNNMVNMALTPDTIPVWLASYLLVNFEQDENGIPLPSADDLYLPTLPDYFYTGIVYMLSNNYRVQIRSHYFTNGIFDVFTDQEEYSMVLSETRAELQNDPNIQIRSTEESLTEGVQQTITTYLKDGIRYTRVESSFSEKEKNFFTVEIYPMPYIGGSDKVDPTSGYPESLTVFVEQDGLYGWFYLTQFGRELTLEDISCFGLTPYTPQKN